MTEPSEQTLFSEAAREAAERVVTAMARENEGYVGPYDEWLPQTLAAALDADPRAKAFLELARLSDEELTVRAIHVDTCPDCGTPTTYHGLDAPGHCPHEYERREPEVYIPLAALGLPVAEQETTG